MIKSRSSHDINLLHLYWDTIGYNAACSYFIYYKKLCSM